MLLPACYTVLAAGGGFSLDVSLPSVQVTVGTGDSAPGVRRGGNSGPDSW
jgi:hypothetical protein